MVRPPLALGGEEEEEGKGGEGEEDVGDKGGVMRGEVGREE